jgi:hypothetical protein
MEPGRAEAILRGLRQSFGEQVQTLKKSRIVTTSWDDGYHADLKLAEFLRARGVQGTFYVPINYLGRALDLSQLNSLASEGFEIGAHGVTHRTLWHLGLPELVQEIGPCKRILEDLLGREVRMFAYPRGRYDARVVSVLREAGYSGARTTRMLAARPGFHPFEMPTTLQVFPHGRSTYLKNVARSRSFESLQTCLVQMARLGNWVELGKALFDEVLEKGGIWHLCGHSWEIEGLNLWDGLREILDYVGGREGVRYVSNSELVPAVTARSAQLVKMGVPENSADSW